MGKSGFWIRVRCVVVIPAICVAVGGCSRIAGVVVDEHNRPVPTAIFSVGRPDAIATYGTHRVDARGRFSFQLSAVDETNLYVYDGAADPGLTLEHVDRSQLGPQMRVPLHRARPGDQEEDLLKVPAGLQ